MSKSIYKMTNRNLHHKKRLDCKDWEYFVKAPIKQKEYFAQIYTYLKLLNDNNQQLMDIMNKLAEVQPSTYQSYKDSISKPIAAINRELYEARRMIPRGFELYPEALKKTWKVEFDNRKKYQQCITHSSFNPMIGNDIFSSVKNIYETVTEGTKFTVSTNKIQISSYDYSPTSDNFTDEATLKIYQLLCENKDVIKNNAIDNKSKKPLFCFVLDNKEYFLDLEDYSICDIWRDVVAIISGDYPVLGNVLRKYENNLT